MNVRIALILTMIFSMILCSCSYDLEEVENAYSVQETIDAKDGVCDHYFQYGYTLYYANNNIYPPSQYHYVSCAKYGIDPLCDFYPRCERHQCVDDSSAFFGNMITYNGYKYSCIPQKCIICGQSAGFRYLLDEES